MCPHAGWMEAARSEWPESSEAALVEEGLGEEAVLQGLENLGGDASAEIHASGGEDFEGNVAGLCTVSRSEDLHGLEADGAGAIFGALADDGVGIIGGQACAEPLGLVELFNVAQEGVDVLDAEAGDDALPADAALEGVAEIVEEGDLAIGARGEVAVAAFGGDGHVLFAVPDEERFAEAGACGDETAMSGGVWVAGLEGEDALRCEFGDAVAVGFEVVDEEDVPDRERLRKIADVEGPGQVGELEAALADRAGEAEAGGEGIFFFVCTGAVLPGQHLFHHGLHPH